MFDFSVRVRYCETDGMGHVHHSSYLLWLEEARTAFLRARGLKYSDMEKEGVFLPVAEISVKYRKPAYFEEEVIIRLTVKKIRSASFSIQYTITRKEGPSPLAEAESLHPVTDSSGKVIPIPERLMRILRKEQT